ncbi:unnamed protein product [Darwinula stevensoni]|uniref:dolichyl-diphosphooligosaccharide--protein glycotransferase n=1 Tax=Darwinula stevensoni TaxID=69355 RepID=A0A7R8XLK4_9CRUS|nr:unnamed protein product [Darwinula stevensoni]CAG0894342.1 unnamed protein product [Darwinula stevensoni]
MRNKNPRKALNPRVKVVVYAKMASSTVSGGPGSYLNIKSVLFNPTGWRSLITFTVLALAWLAGFSSRLFSVIRFESIIHEFDPWFNYRSTAYMVKHGFYNFLNWFDDRAWYPLGRIVGGTVYPGLMITSGAIHHILHLLNIPIHIQEICVFLAPIFSGMTAIATYLLTKELWSNGAGLFAASFIAIVPGYISRSVAGSYDNEGIAIFALMFTYYLWVKSVKTGTTFWAAMAAFSYMYMVSAWGGYVFIINLVPLHVFVLLLMGRFSLRIYTAYTVFYIVGLIMSMQIPFVGFQPVRTSEHMAAAGVFVLLNVVGGLRYIQGFMSKAEFRYLAVFGSAIAAGVVFLGVVVLTYAGFIAPWSGRFYSLWDTGYAKLHIPIIASVSEHQPTTWFAFFFDLHILIAVFPVGVWYCIRYITDERVFIVLYALTATYFAGVMVRLMLTLTPVVCVLSGIAFSELFSVYMKDEDGKKHGDESNGDAADRNNKMYDKAGKVPKMKHEVAKEDAGTAGTGLGMNLRSIVVVAMLMMLLLFAVHCTWVTSHAYSSPSIIIATYSHDGTRHIIDDFREAYYWLWQNTPEDSRIMSWWDYGYQIAGMGNRTTLVDNNTWNNTHIALVGKAMASNESTAYPIMLSLGVDYVLVIFGGAIGYSGDDINKFLWMVRIAEGEWPTEVREKDYFTERGEYKVNNEATDIFLNCMMYKMCYYKFADHAVSFGAPRGYDRLRSTVIGNMDFDLKYLEEAYTTENWIVRIYKVKKPESFIRHRIPATKRVVKPRNFLKKGKKVGGKGVIKNRPSITKGKRPQKPMR